MALTNETIELFKDKMDKRNRAYIKLKSQVILKAFNTVVENLVFSNILSFTVCPMAEVLCENGGSVAQWNIVGQYLIALDRLMDIWLPNDNFTTSVSEH